MRPSCDKDILPERFPAADVSSGRQNQQQQATCLEARFRQKIRGKEGQERERPPTSRSTSFQHDRAPEGGTTISDARRAVDAQWLVPNFFTAGSATPRGRKLVC